MPDQLCEIVAVEYIKELEDVIQYVAPLIKRLAALEPLQGIVADKDLAIEAGLLVRGWAQSRSMTELNDRIKQLIGVINE